MGRTMQSKRLINKISLSSGDKKELDFIKSEIDIHQKLNHKNVIKLFHHEQVT